MLRKCDKQAKLTKHSALGILSVDLRYWVMSDSLVLNFASGSHSKLVILAVVEFLHKRSFSYLYPCRTEENPSSAWELESRSGNEKIRVECMLQDANSIN